MADDDGGFGDWGEEEAVEEVPEEGADGEPTEEGEEGATEEPTEGETGAEGEEEGIPDEELEPQEPERKLFWSKWERPKSHIYDYNYGYFNNYYSGTLNALNERNNSHSFYPIKPLAESWAERSVRMYKEMDLKKERGQLCDDKALAKDIRRGAIEYWVHQKEYSKKYTGYNHA